VIVTVALYATLPLLVASDSDVGIRVIVTVRVLVAACVVELPA
jgi:hypothetical protein